jgi:uncharacterized protein DUF4337
MTEPHEAAHEAAEHIEHEGHEGHGSANKKIALLIAVLALFLAFSETLGKSSQTNAISKNVESANLWAFFQAKSIRRTTIQTAAEEMKIYGGLLTDDAMKAASAKQLDDWQKTAARYRSEPETGEGTEQLAERAKHASEERDHSLAKYHNFELASAAFQVAIVLASATIITGMMVLAWISGILGLGGLVLMSIGVVAPHLIHYVPLIGGH